MLGLLSKRLPGLASTGKERCPHEQSQHVLFLLLLLPSCGPQPYHQP
ncbi:hypothetical protein EI42_05619 [Thermosporothrix hazakensis]|uniref:Uncharacterized protein n=1 Tax=Thermosporothrix hazakensis TaxID=644383 RepID=A0A326TXE0_THEHA|nr:hypothetical protein EI42_05619 [Thermosporothrix hazakensis]